MSSSRKGFPGKKDNNGPVILQACGTAHAKADGQGTKDDWLWVRAKERTLRRKWNCVLLEGGIQLMKIFQVLCQKNYIFLRFRFIVDCAECRSQNENHSSEGDDDGRIIPRKELCSSRWTKTNTEHEQETRSSETSACSHSHFFQLLMLPHWCISWLLSDFCLKPTLHDYVFLSFSSKC